MELITWKIECAHTPETIDRILMPIRKRAMTVESLQYKKTDSHNAQCILSFMSTSIEAEKIYKNMLRIYDIKNIIR
jgi:acetolactate synthase II small subunit